MADLAKEIEVYGSLRESLEAQHSGKWVVIYGADFVGAFDSFDAAATQAVSRYGRGPYLIRQVGAPSITIPSSGMFIFQNA